MSELRALVEAARALREERCPFIVATVVRVQGSSYRRPGARMIASQKPGEPARWVAGSVSGGCLERDVLTRGFWRTREQRCVLVVHDNLDDESLATGCDGKVDLLIERAEAPDACDPFTLAERALMDERRSALVTVYRSSLPELRLGDRVAVTQGEVASTFDSAPLQAELVHAACAALAGASPARALITERFEALVEVFEPPPHLFVLGTAHDAAALVAVARPLGFSITVCDHASAEPSVRQRFGAAHRYLAGTCAQTIAELDRCARPIAVVMGHHYEQDKQALQALASSRALYIGMLGPRRRTERMLDELGASGVAVHPARVHAPAGLDLRAETPLEIALSILAEAQAVVTGADGGSLRDKARPIHE